MAPKIQRKLIAPYNSGLEKHRDAWLLSNDAFSRLRNAYIYRGRVRKRFGSTPFGGYDGRTQRLRINLGQTQQDGTFNATVPGGIYKVGQQFLIDDTFFEVPETGQPVQLLHDNNTITAATYNTDTGEVDIAGAPSGTAVFFYPGLPVMGIHLYEQPTAIQEITIAFDTRFAYRYAGTALSRISGGDSEWSGSDSDFFWAENYRGANASDVRLYVVNNVPDDGVRFFDGNIWTRSDPQYGNDANQIILTSRIVVSFKDRLLLLNVVEQDQDGTTQRRYSNRCRYSANGDPEATNAWNQETPEGGSFIDAPTKEAIVSVGMVQDRLIVYFERSTYELAYTQNYVIPFVWRNITPELGAEASHSIIELDNTAIAFGNVGVHVCDGSQTKRLDSKIPDEIFNIQSTQQARQRTYGVRDFQPSQLYWTVNRSASDNKFPDTVYAYNYDEDAWAIHDDSITAFGYAYRNNSITWQDANIRWDAANFTWSSGGNLSNYMLVIAGNQQGHIFIIDSEVMWNAAALTVSNITVVNPGERRLQFTVNDHNLTPNDFVQIVGGRTLNSGAYEDLNLARDIYRVYDTPDNDTIIIDAYRDINGDYRGGATLRTVSQIEIETKDLSFFLEQGYSSFVPQIDFLVERTNSGSLAIEYYTDSNTVPLVEQSRLYNYLDVINPGDFNLNTYADDRALVLFADESYERTQTRLWKPMYFLAEGQTVRIHLFLNPNPEGVTGLTYENAQMTNRDIVFSDFQLHGMLFYVSPSVRGVY